MAGVDPDDVTRLLEDWNGGNESALNELLPLVYDELRRVAAAYLRRERPDHTLRATDLVHEAYMRLVRQRKVEACTRTQFFAIAANLMRQVLVRHAEHRAALKRGSGNRVTLAEKQGAARDDPVDVLALDRALKNLAHLDQRQGRIVELRFFGGLTELEIAEVLAISESTVRREWRSAKAILHHELRSGPQ